MKTTQQLIQALNYFDLINKLKKLFTRISEESQVELLANIQPLGTTTNLTAIAAVYTDLAEARTSVNTLRTNTESRLDAIEAKLDAVINSLKA